MYLTTTYALCLYFSFGYIDAVSDHTIALISLNLYRPLLLEIVACYIRAIKYLPTYSFL